MVAVRAQGLPAGAVEGPLAGVTVIALEHAVAAPFASRQLADLGARVIKVERVDGGDFARGYDRALGGELSSIFAWLGRGKESIALDLKKPEGREVLDRLLAEADVFVQNLAPGAIERMGYDPDHLRERFPRLIVASNSGYGRTGPYAGRRAYDTLVQSESGAVAVTGSGDHMVKPGFSAADVAGGLYLTSGILMALYQRERTGQGTVIDVAMLDAITDLLAHHIYFAQATGEAAPRIELGHPSLTPYGAFPTADGSRVVIAVQNDREWVRLCEALLRDPALATDPEAATNVARNRNREYVQDLVAAATARLGAAELTAVLDRAEIAWSRINSVEEAAAHPQHAARNRWVPVPTPVGAVPMFRQVITERGRDYPVGSVPALGEHTEQVLLGLGYGQERVELLRKTGVVAGAAHRKTAKPSCIPDQKLSHSIETAVHGVVPCDDGGEMNQTAEAVAESAIAPDCRGQNFWRVDPAARAILRRYLPAELHDHVEPHLDRLGELAGGRLDELATLANEHEPILHPRDRFGRDQDWIEYHPAYREMEQIAFGDFGIHAMTHRPGVLGWGEPLPATVKYFFHYLFAQSECGFMCPINVTDTTAFVLSRYGSPEIQQRFLPRLLSQDMSVMWRGTQFMTEKNGGSDVGTAETRAVHVGTDENGLDCWKLYGDKWFASHTTADVALILARPDGAESGSRGLALFAMPHRLENGDRNHFRMVRLKNKLGTKSLASSEIVLDGALAYLVGDPGRGLRQIMDQVNQSRLSHGVRAAAMMRRCLNESLAVARNRHAFGKLLIDQPLMRRQLLKIMIPTEQALSVAAYTAHAMSDGIDSPLLRILTPLVKFRACRDNIRVASAALEVRGGNGYIEEWVNARLVRDAQVGTLWEGTSNINAIDIVGRAVARIGSQEPLADALHTMLEEQPGVPAGLRGELRELIDTSVELVAKIGADPDREQWYRWASSALYNVTSAVLLAVEGADFGSSGGDARRLLLARLVIDTRLRPIDPLTADDAPLDDEIATLLLDEAPVPLERAATLADHR